MQEWLQKIDAKLAELLDDTPVAAAARYSLFSGGKRLRPLFTLSTAYSLKAPLEKAIIPACAIELIHTYSMIHDDLPAMDNDDFRRGKPTLHKVHNEAKAILAGDYLLTIAFEALANSDLDISTKVELIKLIANRSASKGMIGGQWQDIESEKKRLSLEETEKLHHMKTGALIEASILAGAYVAQAPADIQEKLSQFALKIGLAFQVIDDVLDHTHPHEKHGVKSDLEKEKSTYVSLMGIEDAKRHAEKLYVDACDLLPKEKYNFDLLKDLARMSVFRSK